MGISVKELKVWLSQCSSCCPGFSCVWRRRKNVHRFQVSSAQIETHQKFTHTAKDNIVDINDETLRSREMSKVTRHKQTLDSEIRGQINLANEPIFKRLSSNNLTDGRTRLQFVQKES
ncbi:hypothetical protein OS493_016512 [Desmophyllum pertusum]|uniref:Uncharacterized protein n=1 Tax=Desmophyllum pertusum TaxID=174260 RepID=A0A9W9ZPC1_9CNID|nr:hypothetical protein OS493_016512 [Desmophyllum pertusum]